MARFLEQPNERTLVNKYVDSFMNGVNQYSKYIDSTPSFVTYYSRDLDLSMENPGLGTVKEIVGYESPNKYNRINNFPLYGVEEVDPNINMDGISGINTDIESVAIILPDTIIPKPDDLFTFSYSEKDNEKFRIFRITNVDMNAIDSNSYYQISYVSTSYELNILENRQLVDKYEFVYANIGSEEESILLESKFIEARKLEKILEEFLSYYKDRFFNSRLNVFELAKDDGVVIYSPEVNDFISNTNIYIRRRTFIENIKNRNIMVKHKKNPNTLRNLYKLFEVSKIKDMEHHISNPLEFFPYMFKYREVCKVLNPLVNLVPNKYIQPYINPKDVDISKGFEFFYAKYVRAGYNDKGLITDLLNVFEYKHYSPYDLFINNLLTTEKDFNTIIKDLNIDITNDIYPYEDYLHDLTKSPEYNWVKYVCEFVLTAIKYSKLKPVERDENGNIIKKANVSSLAELVLRVCKKLTKLLKDPKVEDEILEEVLTYENFDFLYDKIINEEIQDFFEHYDNEEENSEISNNDLIEYLFLPIVIQLINITINELVSRKPYTDPSPVDMSK